MLGSWLLAASVVGGWAAENDDVITPGQKIGQVAIGAEIASVVNILGPATVTTGGAKGGSNTWISKAEDNRQPEETSIVSGPGRSATHVVRQISVTSAFFHTREGNSTKSDLAALWKEFPNLRYRRYGDQGDTSHVQLYDSLDQGIAVMVQLTPHPAAGQSWGRCCAIIVHQPGKKPDFVNLTPAKLALL